MHLYLVNEFYKYDLTHIPVSEQAEILHAFKNCMTKYDGMKLI